MLSDCDLGNIRVVLEAQRDLVRRLDARTAALETAFTDNALHASALVALQQLMAQIETQADLLDPADLAAFDGDAITRLYAARQTAVTQHLDRIDGRHWGRLVRSSEQYVLLHGLDPFVPYDALLTDDDRQRLRDESFDAQLRWDRWDYLFVGASGVLAALTDVLLVKTPATSPLTTWIKQYDTTKADDWFARWARSLEKTCKVPYDAMADQDGTRIPGMHGRSHRFQSLSHDPVLGFIFGVLDIMRGTITGFSYDHLRGRHAWVQTPVANVEPIDLISAILRHLGHLISDVATPMGLPTPFLTLLQGINAGSFGEKGRTAAQVARAMYLQGYDLRHFLAGGLTPAVIEIVLRAYILLRHYAEHGDAPRSEADRVKERTMLLAAHGIAALANAGKVALYSGNPLAINVAEWYALVGYLVPSLQYWVFDAHRLRMEHLERVTDRAWAELLANGDRLLARALSEHGETITLGKSIELAL